MPVHESSSRPQPLFKRLFTPASNARAWPELLVVSAALAGLFCYDLSVLTRAREAVGVDGYYYVAQVDYLKAHGQLYYASAAPLVLYGFGCLSHFTGDTVLSIKLGAAALDVLLCGGVFLIIHSLTRSLGLGLFGIVLAALPGLHLYMITEFVNYLGGVTMLTWCGVCLMRAAKTSRPVWLACAGAALVSAGFCHRSVFPISLSIGVAGALAYFIVSPRWKRFRYAAFLACAVFWLSPAVAANQAMIALPAELQRDLSGVPQLSFVSVAGGEKLLLLIIAPTITFLIVAARERAIPARSAYVLVSVALWSLLLNVNPFLSGQRGMVGVAGRLSCLAYIQTAVLLPCLVWLLIPARKLVLYGLILLAAPFMWLSTRELPGALRPQFMEERAEMVRGLAQHRGELGADTIVLAAHGNEFVVTSLMGLASQQRWPSVRRFESVYWLLTKVRQPFLTPATVIVAEENDGTYIAIVPDADLRSALDSMADEERRAFVRRNPHLYEHLTGRRI